MAKPKIRFNGYTEDWEQRKLGDLTKELSDYATMASGLPLLTSSRSGLMYQSDFRDRKTTTSDETLFSIVPKGSCTYRHMSDDDIFHLNINVLEKGLVSREYPVFISSEDNDLEFIIQHINSSDRFRGFCKGQKKGGTRTRLYYKTLCEFEMMTPLIEEQKKISATLHNLDYLITLHQRKCEQTKTLKKYMLQKMFPQDGEKVPQIRFEGFTEDWEQRKLGDLVDRVTRKNQDLVSELPLTISAQYGLIDQNEFFDKRVASKDVSGYYLIENGEFAYNKSTSTDAPWGAIKRLDRYENGVLSTLYIIFGIKENNPVDSDFLVSYYSTNLWHKGIHEIAAEGARNHGLLNIAPADFFATRLMIPQDIEEQKKIGKYFIELEALITLHQRKCDELKEVKKFMLQNMFV